MKLEIGKIEIKDICFSDKTKIKDHVLYINKDELLEDINGNEDIKSIDIDLVKPGDSVRIIPVKDVIEPRIKVEGEGGVFPGFLSDEQVVGSGKTLALKGCTVVKTVCIASFFFDPVHGYVRMAYELIFCSAMIWIHSYPYAGSYSNLIAPVLHGLMKAVQNLLAYTGRIFRRGEVLGHQ